MQNKNLGILYAFLGVFILSFDSVLVRLIDSAPWDLVFWRGALLSITMADITWFTSYRAKRKISFSWSAINFVGGLAFATSTSFFVLSINNTDAASTLAIFNTAPFFAAIIAFITMRETLATHTLVAMVTSILGVSVIFSHGMAVGQAQGDYYALVAAIGSAIYLVCLRKSQGEHSGSILIIGGTAMAIIALLAGAVPSSLNQIQLCYMAILGCIIVPFSAVFIAFSSKYLPAAQTALVLLLELLLGPLWVYMVLGDRPANKILIGGSIVLVSLIAHSLWERYEARKMMLSR